MNLAAEQQFPTKWPFPPTPPGRRALGSFLARLRRGRTGVRMAAGMGGPDPLAVGSASAVPALSAATPEAEARAGDVTLGRMIVDILLVAMWGAMIPVLMWLGAAAGF
jgi:hypothetical protein